LFSADSLSLMEEQTEAGRPGCAAAAAKHTLQAAVRQPPIISEQASKANVPTHLPYAAALR
jgi:hypothetical protein